MGRAVLVSLLAAGTLAVAGCGDTPVVSAPAAPRAEAPASVEVTDGRLGGAVEARVGARPRELAPAGRPSLADRGSGPRRDGVGAGAACPVVPDVSSLPAVTDATLCLLNGERADRGLPPFAHHPALAEAATVYAADLVAGSYFSHTGRDGSDLVERIERAGYISGDRSWRVGENLAWGTGGLATPAAIVQAWMNSAGHRKNILNARFREIGIGVVAGNPARGDNAGATYVTEFGVVEAPAAGGAAPVSGAAPDAKQAKRAKHARKARRAKARKARAGKRRSAHAAQQSRGGKRKRRVKSRGPVARIAI